MWQVCLEGVKDVGSLCYGWRAEADVAWEGRSRFHPGRSHVPIYCTTQSVLHHVVWTRCSSNVPIRVDMLMNVGACTHSAMSV